MTLKQQYEIYKTQLATRKRNPIKKSSLNVYQSIWRTWIEPELGDREVASIENGTMKAFVSKLAQAGLAAASIAGVTQLVRGLVASVTDENGNELYPRKWNADFIDAPIVDPKAQKTPTMDSRVLSKAIATAPSQYGPLLALLAGSGCRINEALALKVGLSLNSSYWDFSQSKLVIRKTLYRGAEQTTKTAAGEREVDLDPALNAYLSDYFKGRKPGTYLFCNEDGSPLYLTRAYKAAEQAKVPGFHSLRRFRITHLENAEVPRGLQMFWTGHAGQDVHDRYVMLSRNMEARKDWASRAGLGFTLPKKNNSEEGSQMEEVADPNA